MKTCNKCHVAREASLEVDHIIPISKGGEHCLKNMQMLTGHENRLKADRII